VKLIVPNESLSPCSQALLGNTLSRSSASRVRFRRSVIAVRSRASRRCVPKQSLGTSEIVDDCGILTCLDALSGARRWQKGLPGRYTASPIAGDGKIYFFNEDGTATVISASEKRFHQLFQNAIGEPIFATPALSGGRLFIRTPEHLWCIGRER
jgi:outer membrane protein assembly factor BamB